MTAGTVRVGTAGWSIPSRYLGEIAAGGSQLSRYARVFPVTEIDSAFHRPHRVATYARWAASVGDEFRFCVKLPKALTHQGTLVTGPSEVRDRFLTAVAGLGSKLAVLLVQLPPSLAFEDRAVRVFFDELRAATPLAVAIACEPRHASRSTADVEAASPTGGEQGRRRSGALGHGCPTGGRSPLELLPPAWLATRVLFRLRARAARPVAARADLRGAGERGGLVHFRQYRPRSWPRQCPVDAASAARCGPARGSARRD